MALWGRATRVSHAPTYTSLSIEVTPDSTVEYWFGPLLEWLRDMNITPYLQYYHHKSDPFSLPLASQEELRTCSHLNVRSIYDLTESTLEGRGPILQYPIRFPRRYTQGSIPTASRTTLTPLPA